MSTAFSVWSLKELFARAVAHELGLRADGGGIVRLDLPLVGRASKPVVSVSNADIEEAIAAEDAERYDGR